MFESTKLTRILLGLLIFNVLILVYLPPLRYRGIVIHHSATASGDLDAIRRVHHERGWSEAAYHLVLSNGSTEIPAGHLEPTRRFLYWLPSVGTSRSTCNVLSIHLCVVGDYENAPFPDGLRSAMGFTVATLQRRYGIPDSRVALHRDCNATLCPGRHLETDALLAWAADPALVPPEATQQQQLGVLRRSTRSLSIGLVALDLCVLLGMFLRPLPRDAA